MVTPPHRRKSSRGSVLMLVVWALALLSFLILSWSDLVHFRFERFNQQGDQTKARFAALSGLQLGLDGSIPEHADLLQDWEIEPEIFVDVVVESEGGRLNLNYVLSRVLLDGTVRQRLRQFLVQGFEVPPNEVDRVMDALLDWVDQDDLRRSSGIEEAPGYKAQNRYFENLDEIALVRGSEWITRNENWRDQLTLWSSGKIDVNWASARLLQALPGIDERDARRIRDRVAGPDGELRTKDDEPFTSPDEFRAFVGLSDPEFSLLSPWIATDDGIKRISARGRSYDVVHRVEIVVQGRSANATVKAWLEP
ncbi:MAG: hypothetical protein AAGK14_02690 [Verrucomicrobiota bacterium]